MSPFRTLGVWYVALTPVLAGLSMLEFRFGDLNYTGFLWAGMLALGLMILTLIRLTSKEPLLVGTWWPWLIWCGFVWMSVLWTKDVYSRTFQDAMQITMPVVVGMIAACTVRTRSELKLVLGSFVVALALLTLYTIAYLREGPGSPDEENWLQAHLRGAALAATIVGCIFLAGFPGRKIVPLLGWGCALAITAVTGSRIATLALLVAMMIHPLMGSFRRVAALAVGALVGIALFYTPTFQERFFVSGSGSLSDLTSGEVEGAGRFENWAKIWTDATERPLLGTGVGTSHEFVEVVWGDTDQVHNDYLRMFYELGLAGVAIFLAVFGWQMVVLARQIRQSDGVLQRALVAAFLGFGAMLVTCLTDNTITYNLIFTDPLFAVLGAAAGVMSTEWLPASNRVPGNALWRVGPFLQHATGKP